MGHIFCFVLESLYFIIVKKNNNICILKGPLSPCFLTCERARILPLAGLLWRQTEITCLLRLYCMPRAWPSAGPVTFLCFSMTLGSAFSEPRPGNVLTGLLEMFIFCDCFIYSFTYYYRVLKMKAVLYKYSDQI